MNVYHEFYCGCKRAYEAGSYLVLYNLAGHVVSV
jgi:hypothetical protein